METTIVYWGYIGIMEKNGNYYSIFSYNLFYLHVRSLIPRHLRGAASRISTWYPGGIPILENVGTLKGNVLSASFHGSQL